MVVKKEFWVESFALNKATYQSLGQVCKVHIFGKTPKRNKILVLPSTRDRVKYDILVGRGLGGQFLTLT